MKKNWKCRYKNNWYSIYCGKGIIFLYISILFHSLFNINILCWNASKQSRVYDSVSYMIQLEVFVHLVFDVQPFQAIQMLVCTSLRPCKTNQAACSDHPRSIWYWFGFISQTTQTDEALDHPRPKGIKLKQGFMKRKYRWLVFPYINWDRY